MMLKVNQLTKHDIKPILTDSIALMIRRPIDFVLLSAFSLILYYGIIQFFEPIGYLVSIFPVLIGTLIAKASDDNDSVMRLIKKTPVSALKNAVIGYVGLYVVFLIITLFVDFLFSGIGSPTTPNETKDSLKIWFVEGSKIYDYFSILIGYSLMIVPCASTIILLHNVPLDVAYNFTNSATKMNRHILLFFALIIFMIGVVIHFFGFLFFITMPFICCLHHVIYRNLYTDQKRNKKVEEKVQIQIPSMAS